MIRSEFTCRGIDGDFAWMIEQPQYARALFVFNDNENQFLAHQERRGTEHSCSRGGGNAVIRPYECLEPPRATGVPTGSFGGYSALDAHSRQIIDQAIDYVRMLLSSGGYEQVVVSWDSAQQTLGTGIFVVSRDVADYIIEQIELAVAEAPAD